MKKQLLITLVGILMLISLAQVGILNAAAADPHTTPGPSEIVTQMNIAAVHCGDAIIANGKLINKNTGEGITGATLTMQLSLDGNNWIPAGSVKTDGTGSVSYPLTVPDPRTYGYTLPLKVYCMISYDGSSVFAPTSKVFSVTVLPPS
ncbi:MAG: hypothetical protein WCE81_02560 [Halobacteriota archaeon]